MKYSIKVNEVKGNDSNVRGFATVVFGDSFKITNIAILENTEKQQLFVSMPRYKSNERDENNNPVYKDICNPITKEFREELYGQILDAYENIKNQEKMIGTEEPMEEPAFSVNVTPFERENGNVKGLARIYFDDCFIVNNVTLLQGKDRVFVAMPSYKTKQVDDNNKPVYQDVCYPVTKEFREKLYDEIINTYEREVEKQKEQSQKNERPLNRREQYQMAHREDKPFR